MKLVSLPMYDWPEVEAQTDRLWQQLSALLQDNGIDCPSQLDRKTGSSSLWNSGNCLFSQTCGWPYIKGLKSQLNLLTTPIYAIEGCDGTNHSSQLICRNNDPRDCLADFKDAIVVINAADSQSGHQAMKSALTLAALPAPFFGKGIVSGAHRNSIAMIANSEADIAAIDPVSWQLAKRYDAATTDQLRVIGQGPAIPGLPLVYSHQFTDQMTKAAIAQKVEQLLANELDPDVREHLFIAGARKLPAGDYVVLKDLDHAARVAGHLKLA